LKGRNAVRAKLHGRFAGEMMDLVLNLKAADILLVCLEVKAAGQVRDHHSVTLRYLEDRVFYPRHVVGYFLELIHIIKT
jgi:hypothetical protein